MHLGFPISIHRHWCSAFCSWRMTRNWFQFNLTRLPMSLTRECDDFQVSTSLFWSSQLLLLFLRHFYICTAVGSRGEILSFPAVSTVIESLFLRRKVELCESQRRRRRSSTTKKAKNNFQASVDKESAGWERGKLWYWVEKNHLALAGGKFP